MYGNEDSSSESSVLNQSNKLQLTDTLLIQLGKNDEHFLNTIVDFLRKGVQLIKESSIKEAYNYLNQAQTILQYGANCGKIIERKLILCVLHNKTCCFQKLLKFKKSSVYLEAIIFNIGQFLKNLQSRNSQQLKFKKNSYEISKAKIKYQYALSRYYLQYCAINSNINKHKLALDSAKTALQYSKVCIKNVFENQRGKINDKKLVQTLHELSYLDEVVDSHNFKEYLRIASYFASRKVSQISVKSTHLKMTQYLKNYSISNVMQIIPQQYQAKQNNEIDSQKIYEKIMQWGVCYFSIATQIRNLANQFYGQNEIKESQQFIKAKIYHLLAIIFLCHNITAFETFLVKQLVQSFEYHYGQDLTQSLEIKQPSLNKIFNTQPIEKKIIKSKSKSKQKLVNIMNAVKVHDQIKQKKIVRKHQKVQKQNKASPKKNKKKRISPKSKKKSLSKQKKIISSSVDKNFIKKLIKNKKTQQNLHSSKHTKQYYINKVPKKQQKDKRTKRTLTHHYYLDTISSSSKRSDHKEQDQYIQCERFIKKSKRSSSITNLHQSKQNNIFYSPRAVRSKTKHHTQYMHF